AEPGRAGGVRVLDQQQRRVRAAVRRAGGVRGGVPGPRAAAGEGRRRALHAALHHVVLPRRVPGHAAVRVAVHQPRPLLRAGPGGGPGRRLPGPRRGAGEPPAAVRAPGGQRPQRVVGVVGLRGRLPRAVLHAGEEVLPRVRRGGGGVAGPAGGADRQVHGRPRRRRRQRRAPDGAGRAGRAGGSRRRHHPAHAGHQQRAVPGEAGEHGRPQGDLRRFQGDHGAPHGDGRVHAQQRRLLARRQDQHHRVQGHVQGEGVRVSGGGRRAVRGKRVQGVQARRAGAVRRQQRRVLEGDEARQDLLRLQGLGVAQRVRVPAGVQGRRHHLRRCVHLVQSLTFLPLAVSPWPVAVGGRRLMILRTAIADVDECSEKLACTCPGCSCQNNWGGYHCSCGGGGNQVYIQAEDTCVGKSAAAMGWLVTVLVLSCLAGAGLAGFAFYKYRLRRYMDSEVAAIMSQYMPLESQSTSGENRPLREEAVEAA
ncbi:hypothetical protein CFC21_018627, partial [Triticum aestivum]